MNQLTSLSSFDQPIGELIKIKHNLTDEQVKSILEYQAQNSTRFGESAVALGYIKPSDVLSALSKQFDYPNTLAGQTQLSAELITAHQPFSSEAEIFRDIRSQVISGLALPPDAGGMVLAVVSPNSGDGKSFFAANLAVAFSQLGGRTLIIDANLRNPRQHEIFSIENKQGLSSLLVSDYDVQLLSPDPGLPNLYAITAGVQPPNPLELVQRQNFDLLLTKLRTRFEYVIVDTPAYSGVADAKVIAAKCHAALIVARANVSTAPDIQNIHDGLRRGCNHFLGVALNEYRS